LDVPQSSVGAPLPAILADENTLFVCYLLQNTPPGWDGSTIRLVDSDAEDEPVAVLSVQSCRAHTFGPPNEEAIGGHRLAKLGLEPFAAFEVPGSNWIADMERRNRVHPNHRSSQFSTLRHFIFTFHDSVLEFVSEGFEVEVTSGSIRANLRRLADSL
jgi:hypothetical protein